MCGTFYNELLRMCSHVDTLKGSHFMYCEQHSLAYYRLEMLFVRSDHHCIADFTVFSHGETFVGAVRTYLQACF